MKVLIDTCGWIEWLTNGKLIKSFAPYFKKTNELIIPTLIQYELYKWTCREKNAQLALEIIGITESGNVIPLDTQLALLAADFASEYQLAMADAIIYATARTHRVQLITSDKHFQKLQHVEYFEK